MIVTGDLDEGERWLQRAGPALEADAGPGIRMLAHIVSGMLQAGRGCLNEAAGEFGAAKGLGSRLTGSHAQANQVTGWCRGSLRGGPPCPRAAAPGGRPRVNVSRYGLVAWLTPMVSGGASSPQCRHSPDAGSPAGRGTMRGLVIVTAASSPPAAHSPPEMSTAVLNPAASASGCR